MSYPPLLPGGLSPNSYLARRLHPADAEHYSAAGLLPYRRGAGEALEFLLPLERPWNSFTKAYDPLGWNLFCGKRIPRQERFPETTAVRSFQEAAGKVSGAPAPDVLYSLLSKSIYAWYSLGKFALLLVEVDANDIPADFPERYTAWKQGQQQEEYQVTAEGVKKWSKLIDAMEWVPASTLFPEPQKEASDLLSNVLRITKFPELAEGKLDLATEFPQPPASFKGGKDGGKKGKGKGKGSQKGWGMMPMPPMMPYGGKGYGMQPMMYPAQAPVAAMPYDQSSGELQRQMYGEQLYLLVQPLSPSSVIAQKITGMLLELPENELMLNLNSPEELHRRVVEALEVLKEDGIIA